MRELRFHRDIYRGESVDEALKLFARFARFERDEEPDYWVVRVDAGSERRERRIADELSNYALGLTIRQQGSS